MYTVITKGNNVSKHNSIDSIERSVEGPFLAIDNGNGSKVAFTEDSPITWPTDATNGMQAIVDVKAGTLRFDVDDGWPRAHTEFVVSEYVEQFVSVEDSAPVHVLDLIKEWPTDGTRPAVLVSHPGFSWCHHDGGVWSLCCMNGDNEFFEGHWLNYHENKKKQVAPHIFDSIEWWPVAKNHPTPILPDGFIWVWQFSEWVISNGTVVLYNKDYRKQKYNEEKPDSGGLLGTKHDHGKPILGAVPPHAELAVGRVLTFGAEKYARGNWDKVEDHENRYMDAALRHLNAHRRGELADSESGESHLAHAACCILFMLDKQERS
jgi:hypothetical protein